MPDYGDYYNEFEDIEDYYQDNEYNDDNAQDLCDIFGDE